MVRESLFTRVLPAASASAVVAFVIATAPLSPIPQAIAMLCVVAAWGASALFRRRDVRAHASVVAGIAGVTAAGQVGIGFAYGAACLLFLLACIVTMRASRTPTAATDEAAAVPRRALAVLVLTAAAVTTGLAIGIPRLAEKVERRLNTMFGGDGSAATAFSTTMKLGATRGMLQSNTIVMRIDGERPEYLRGAVYDRYDPPFWVTTDRGRIHAPEPASAPVRADTTTITLVRGTPNGEDMRWFLPPNACDLAVPSRLVGIDGFGIARRTRAEDPMAITYRTASCATPPASFAPPTKADLDLPPRVHRALLPIAKDWTGAARSPSEKLDAIAKALGHFEYSLAVPRTNGLDPIVDFLTVHRAGHCELFASAMVLLARTQGIPARVIGGYRVSATNPITGRIAVRERNAHAWVEAWVDGAWHGWDPTPLSESYARPASTIDNVTDVLSSALDVVVVTLTRLGTFGITLILVAIIVVLLFVRWIDQRLHARRGRRKLAAERSLPLPCFEALTDALARTGHVRDEAEPVETFAHRLASFGASWSSEVATALASYTQLRYGGIGSEAVVVELVERATRAVRDDSRKGPAKA